MSQKIEQDDLALAQLIDVKTRKTMKPGSNLVFDRNGWLGTKILILEPALWRCDPEKAEVKISQEVALVEATLPPVEEEQHPARYRLFMKQRASRHQGLPEVVEI